MLVTMQGTVDSVGLAFRFIVVIFTANNIGAPILKSSCNFRTIFPIWSKRKVYCIGIFILVKQRHNDDCCQWIELMLGRKFEFTLVSFRIPDFGCIWYKFIPIVSPLSKSSKKTLSKQKVLSSPARHFHQGRNRRMYLLPHVTLCPQNVANRS